MKSVLWQNAQRVIRQILDWAQFAKESNIKEHRQDYFEAGILKNLLNEFDIIAGTNNTPLTPSVTIRTGVAYDSNGDRIIIDDENISFDPTNSSNTTNDGLGNLILTPHSTGSKNISLTVNVNNYIWLDYLLTTDETQFTLHKITKAKQFYKRTDGYKITVTTINTPPTVASLKLGNVDLTGSGVVSAGTISKVGRVFSAVKINRVKIKTPKADKTDATVSYLSETEIFLDDHIKAIGNGSVSATNPHGLTPADIGFTNEDEILHQKFLHSNGIVGDTFSITSSLYTTITTVSPGFDFLIVRKLDLSEVAIVDGVTIKNSDLPSDVTVAFNSFDASGIWYIYLDKNTKSISRTQINLITSPDNTKLLLYSVVWTYPGGMGAGDGDLSSLVDRRIFGNISTREIQANTINESKLTTSVAGNGLSGGTGSPLSVNVDNSTIEINADSLRVKDAGITLAKLATEVTDKLSPKSIQTVSAVISWSAEVPSVKVSNVTITSVNTSKAYVVFGGIKTEIYTDGTIGASARLTSSTNVELSASVKNSNNTNVIGSITVYATVVEWN
jgi:hypothetical protein